MQSHYRGPIFALSAIVLAAASLVGASAAAAERPASVPAEFVETPNGYFHPSCVVELGAGETLRADRVIESQSPQHSGRARGVPACAYPHYDRKGVARPATPVASPPPAPPPTIGGWVENGNNGSEGPLSWISANWTVPPSPPVDGGQTVYYFPGLESLEAQPNTGTIMQPVLAYNSGIWTITSWNCCLDGTVVHGPSAVVHPGDTIYGYVFGTNCDANGHCSQWQIYTGDWTNGASSTLNTTTVNVMDWAFAGALEAYGVDTCSELPPTRAVTFTNVQVRTTHSLSVYPTWSLVAGDPTPSCGYAVSSPNTSTVSLETQSL